jgi:hypothetical protein
MCAVSNMAAGCSYLMSCFPGMLLTYFLNDFEMVPVAPIITGITFVFYIIIIIIIIINLEYLNFPFTTYLLCGEVHANIEIINF